jgi:CheY-like chemotaxis protein
MVLVVDDEPSLGVIISSLGRRGGYTTECRLNAVSAWDFLQQTAPDLLLLDVHLPGESGLVLCRRIRETPRLAALRVALFTHWGLSQAIAAGLEAGVDYLVVKDLVGQPRRWLARLGEILPAADGRPAPPCVGWAETGRPPLSLLQNGRWLPALEKALQHPALRDAGSEVLRIVLRRALATAFPPPAEVTIASDGRSVLPGGLPPEPQPEALRRLVGSLAEQMWRLLGTELTSPFWDALAEIIPGSPQFTIQ